MNRLRDRIRVQADGQMRTGRDIVIAALLGRGGVRLRHHLPGHHRVHHDAQVPPEHLPRGRCHAGPPAAARFTGKPEHVVNFMRFVAQDVREIMASLGFRTVDEMVGHVEVLETRTALDHWKSRGLDFSRVLARPEVPRGTSLRCTTKQNHDMSLSLDKELIQKARPALEPGRRCACS